MEPKDMTNEQIQQRKAELEQELQAIEAEQLNRRASTIDAAIDGAIASVREVDAEFGLAELVKACQVRMDREKSSRLVSEDDPVTNFLRLQTRTGF